MALRPTMALLIARLRRMISDPAGAAQAWSDEDLQDFLDPHRCVARYLELPARETILPGGRVEWHDFYSDYGDWEDDVQIVDLTFNPLTPDTSDTITGHWHFAANQLPQVFLVGQTYDLNGAAADTLQAWAARPKEQFDYKTADQQFSRSQKMPAMLALAETFRAKQRPQMATLVRRDTT